METMRTAALVTLLIFFWLLFCLPALATLPALW